MYRHASHLGGPGPALRDAAARCITGRAEICAGAFNMLARYAGSRARRAGLCGYRVWKRNCRIGGNRDCQGEEEKKRGKESWVRGAPDKLS